MFSLEDISQLLCLSVPAAAHEATGAGEELPAAGPECRRAGQGVVPAAYRLCPGQDAASRKVPHCTRKPAKAFLPAWPPPLCRSSSPSLAQSLNPRTFLCFSVLLLFVNWHLAISYIRCLLAVTGVCLPAFCHVVPSTFLKDASISLEANYVKEHEAVFLKIIAPFIFFFLLILFFFPIF